MRLITDLMKPLLYIVLFLSLCVGCSRTSHHARLQQADSLSAEEPDSALSLLKQCLFPERLSDAERAAYARIWANSSLATDHTFALDTMLPQAVCYYKAQKDTARWLECLKLEAARQNELDNYQQGLKLLNQAIGIANASQRDEIYGEIIDCAFWKRDAATVRQYASLMTQSSDSTKQASGYYMLFVCYGLENKDYSDSAYQYIDRCLEIAKANHDKNYGQYLRNSITGNRDLNMNQQIARLREVLAFYHLEENSNIFTDMGFIFLQNHQLDSAEFYARRAKLCYAKDWSDKGYEYVSLRNSINVLQTCIAFAKGEKDIRSKSDIGHFNDSIFTGDIRSKMLKQEQNDYREYTFSRELHMQKMQERSHLLLVSFFFMAIIVAIAVVIYVRNRRNRWIETSEQLETLQQLLRETNAPTETNNNEPLQPVKGDSRFFKQVILQQLGIIRLMATNPTEHNMALLQQMTRIAHKEVSVDTLVNWPDLYAIIDSLYDNFYTILTRHYGSLLSEKEIQICCLLCADFSTKEISTVTQQSLRTVYQRKSYIRGKLQMEEKEDIVSFVRSHAVPV